MVQEQGPGPSSPGLPGISMSLRESQGLLESVPMCCSLSAIVPIPRFFYSLMNSHRAASVSRHPPRPASPC